MFRVVQIAVFALVLMPCVPGRASADIMQYESLDLVVMNADLVIRGEVSETVSKKVENGAEWKRVTVKVTETIKGEKFKEVAFEFPLQFQADFWRNLRGEVLLCLNKGPFPGGPFQTDFVLAYSNRAVALDAKARFNGRIFSLDFKELTDPKEILTAARAAAADRASKPGALAEWIVQKQDSPDRPYTVLYPDSERVRAAAKKRGIDLVPRAKARN